MATSRLEHLESYSEYLRISNYAPPTIKSYLLGLRQFLEFRETNEIVGKLNQEQARQFILFKYDQGAKWPTINNVYSALRKYFREVLHYEWTTKKIPRPRRERTLPVLINKEEVKLIIEHCKMYKYQVFISLLYATGIRLSEALHIKMAHIDGRSLQIHIVKGKGSKHRYVDIPPKLLNLLRTYYRRENPEDYLFNGRIKSNILSCTSAQRAIREAVKRSKILKQVSTHTFRHCYATHHLEQGTNIVYIQKQMGHKHLKTTAKYIRLSKTYHQTIVHPIEGMEIKYMRKSRR